MSDSGGGGASDAFQRGRGERGDWATGRQKLTSPSGRLVFDYISYALEGFLIW